ncbi:hypothetical protein EDD18DRAFT_1207239 [Armillaria luteobubalina]|uniref:Uncharacterized protein n=1 Tax=Armillaria luteobubalina TaxID=153913 RepID=A0AA39TC67_9AGAR|nr:hypothetical protein EDD18DRAFT_1207239 [Armillaria luteobubalina]
MQRLSFDSLACFCRCLLCVIPTAHNCKKLQVKRLLSGARFVSLSIPSKCPSSAMITRLQSAVLIFGKICREGVNEFFEFLDVLLALLNEYVVLC